MLEGTVRRDGNHVRVSTELVDARNDNTIWADSYDRDLTDIFAIQSEVAQTIASKLTATISAEEKKTIEAKPTDNLEAYDLYLRGKERLLSAELSGLFVDVEFLRAMLVFWKKRFDLTQSLRLRTALAACVRPNLFQLRPQPRVACQGGSSSEHCIAITTRSSRGSWPAHAIFTMAIGTMKALGRSWR